MKTQFTTARIIGLTHGAATMLREVVDEGDDRVSAELHQQSPSTTSSPTQPGPTATTEDEGSGSKEPGEQNDDGEAAPTAAAADGAAAAAAPETAATPAPDRARLLTRAAGWALRVVVAVEALSLLGRLWPRRRGVDGGHFERFRRQGLGIGPPAAGRPGGGGLSAFGGGGGGPGRRRRRRRGDPTVWDRYVGLSTEAVDDALEFSSSAVSGEGEAQNREGGSAEGSKGAGSKGSASSRRRERGGGGRGGGGAPTPAENDGDDGGEAEDARARLLAYLSGRAPVAALAGLDGRALARAAAAVRSEELDAIAPPPSGGRRGGGNSEQRFGRAELRAEMDEVVAAMRRAKKARAAIARAQADKAGGGGGGGGGGA